MAVVDIKNCTFKLIGGGTGQELELDVGEGNLQYTEHFNREYMKNKGKLDTVRDGDEQPMDLSFGLKFENLTSKTGEDTTPNEVLKGEAGWDSTSSDPCEPFCCDVQVENIRTCGGSTDTETWLFKEFRVDQLGGDVRAGTLSSTGRCNNRFVEAARS